MEPVVVFIEPRLGQGLEEVAAHALQIVALPCVAYAKIHFNDKSLTVGKGSQVKDILEDYDPRLPALLS